ncbi:hypothetical protein DXG01_009114, partial [Tephrocybe rancida]
KRGFHVALAMEFEGYVLAFLSNDMVYQPIWLESKDKLPSAPPDVHKDFRTFLQVVADWIWERTAPGSRSRRTGLACEKIRQTGDVFGGIGVYTGILAPTQQQRLVYKDWLQVYAKDKVQMSNRLAVLVDDYNKKIHEFESQDKVWYR